MKVDENSPTSFERKRPIDDIKIMIDLFARGKNRRKLNGLGTQNVHGLPMEWPKAVETKAESERLLERGPVRLLGVQNVHGLPTRWNELDFSA